MNSRRHSFDRRSRQERRESPRVPLSSSVRFLRAGTDVDDVLPAELVDVSHTGLRIDLDTPLFQGECILIEVRDSNQHCFNLSAQVVWVEHSPTSAPHRVGCELRVELSRRQLMLMRELVGARQN